MYIKEDCNDSNLIILENASMNANHCGASLRSCLKGEVLFNFLIISLSDKGWLVVRVLYNFKQLYELFALMFESLMKFPNTLLNHTL